MYISQAVHGFAKHAWVRSYLRNCFSFFKPLGVDCSSLQGLLEGLIGAKRIIISCTMVNWFVGDGVQSGTVRVIQVTLSSQPQSFPWFSGPTASNLFLCFYDSRSTENSINFLSTYSYSVLCNVIGYHSHSVPECGTYCLMCETLHY